MSGIGRAGLGKLLALWLATVGFCTAAEASHWWHVAEHGVAPGRVEEFVDHDSVRNNAAGNKLVMTMSVTERSFGAGLNALQGVYEVNCRQGRSRSIMRVGLMANGNPAAKPDQQELPWRKNAADSFAATLQAIVCVGRYPDEAFDIGSLDPQAVTRAYFVGDALE